MRLRNGGIAQALYEIAEEMGLLSKEDKERLDHLRSLLQDRVEGENLIEKTKRIVCQMPTGET